MTSMWDELVEMKHKLEALRPKYSIDVLLSTKRHLGDVGVRVEYDGTSYLIAHERRVDELKAMSVASTPTAGISETLFLGIPVMYDEDLVTKLLHHVVEQMKLP